MEDHQGASSPPPDFRWVACADTSTHPHRSSGHRGPNEVKKMGFLPSNVLERVPSATPLSVPAPAIAFAPKDDDGSRCVGVFVDVDVVELGEQEGAIASRLALRPCRRPAM